ncbi:MAG: crossover junction endodeoxyribonuclease RuvC [SAR202 cluster bacterium Io17-Chloro-G3]|nr:MAG: crossover junction endodeoxyribonuclease RuvC [SAR202 cluster bacterium Io17-Chloro-G3]
MRILGIDPGTVRMGYGILDETDSEVVAVTWGALTASSSLSLGPRLYRIYSQLVDLLSEYSPDVVAIEEPFVSTNPRTAMAIGQAQGLALLVAAENDIPVQGYPPRKVKHAITGNGAATKEQIQQATMLHLTLAAPPVPDDAADALAVALCHLQEARLDLLTRS